MKPPFFGGFVFVYFFLSPHFVQAIQANGGFMVSEGVLASFLVLF